VCSPAFEELVMRCIAKDPAARYASMDAVLQAIKLAHGVSMTGQLAAVNLSGAYGAYGAYGSSPPPPVRSSVPAFAGVSGQQATVGASTSGSQPMGIVSSQELGASGSGAAGAYLEEPPPRSKAWIALGVLAAAALGGLLGMVAFRMTSTSAMAPIAVGPAGAGSGRGVTPAGAPSGGASAGTSGASTPAGGGAAGDARLASIHVTTDPPGANVREDATELCVLTPCDVVWKGEAADPSKTHKLAIIKNGFRVETRSVKGSDPPLVVKLVRGGYSGGGRLPLTSSSAKPAPDGTSPSGFKDLPY
jgi:serine/threonine-protein kinase